MPKHLTHRQHASCVEYVFNALAEDMYASLPYDKAVSKKDMMQVLIASNGSNFSKHIKYIMDICFDISLKDMHKYLNHKEIAIKNMAAWRIKNGI